jgi:hypothetical protein
VADREHGLRSFHVVGSRQRAPENRTDAKHVEETAGDRGGLDVGRCPILGDDVAAGAVRAPRDGLEQLAGVANGVNFISAKRMMCESRGSELFPGDYEPLLVANGHRAQQDAFDHREHHRGSGNTQRERQPRCRTERLRPGQCPPREPDVASQVFEHRATASSASAW